MRCKFLILLLASIALLACGGTSQNELNLDSSSSPVSFVKTTLAINDESPRGGLVSLVGTDGEIGETFNFIAYMDQRSEDAETYFERNSDESFVLDGIDGVLWSSSTGKSFGEPWIAYTPISSLPAGNLSYTGNGFIKLYTPKLFSANYREFAAMITGNLNFEDISNSAFTVTTSAGISAYLTVGAIDSDGMFAGKSQLNGYAFQGTRIETDASDTGSFHGAIFGPNGAEAGLVGHGKSHRLGFLMSD